MKIHSSHAIQDLGSYLECRNMMNQHDESLADYVVLNVNLSHVPIVMHFGQCMPKNCSQTEYDHALYKVSKVLSKVYQDNYYNMFTPEAEKISMIKSWTNISLRIIKTDSWIEEWNNQYQVQYVLTMIFTVVLLVSLCLIPNIYHSYTRAMGIDEPKQSPVP